MKINDLKQLGWQEFFADLCENTEYKVGRVVLQHKYLYRVVDAEGEWIAEPTGKFTFDALTKKDFPSVGDWVLMTTYPNEGKAMIHEVLARKSVFIRQAAGEGAKTEDQIVASNVDYVFLVNSLNDDFNLRRLERYLLLAYESRATPIIILTKRDLCDDLEEKLQQVDSVTFGAVPVVAVDNISGNGLDAVRALITTGTTVALLGSSGVGKSTLLNALMGADVAATAGIREDDSKGRHTTTHRELFMLPTGGLVIDTPGMRELRVTASAELETTFADIEALIMACRFNNCTHGNEPGCKVNAALDDGSLDYSRYSNYQKLQRELAYQNRRQRQNEMLAENRAKKKRKGR
jgi:ribosome biogenesis GTPase